MKRTQWHVLLIVTHLFANVPLLGMYELLIIRLRQPGMGRAGEALINAALFALFGVSHSILARDAVKRRLNALVGEHYVRTVFVVVSGVTLSIMLIGWQPLAGTVWQAIGAVYWLLVLLMVICFLGIAYAISTNDYADYLGLRAHQQRLVGRPALPVRLSVAGLYGYCRHPLYTLVLLSFWITPVMTVGRLEFVMLGSVYIVLGAHLEERNLRREFGELYDLYRDHVPMWVPRLRPWRGERGIAGHALSNPTR